MIAADEDFPTTTNEKSGEDELIIASTKIHNDFNADEDGCSSKHSDKSPDSDLDSDSAVSVLNHLNGKSDGQNDDFPSRSSSIQSDKSAIIRLNSELLKAKQSNWEVVDALTAAYDDIRDLRKREQRLNNILTGNLDKAGSTGTSQADAIESHKATEVRILQTQLEIRGEELSKAKDNIRRLMAERDRLKEECSKTRASLRLLALQDKRKENEITMGESHLKALKEEMREKDDMELVLKENALNLEHQLRKAKNSAQKSEAEKEILKDYLQQRENEIMELKKKLKELENEHDLVRSDLSMRTSELARIKSNESSDIFKEIENELAKELNTMEMKLVEMKEKTQHDDQTIAEMKEKLEEWERYGSRVSKTMDEYINQVNSQQLEARKEIANYITKLEKELAQVKARQQRSLERRGGDVEQTFERNAPQRSPRKRSVGKRLPVLRFSPQETVPTTSRKISDSSLSGALDSEESMDDIEYCPSDINESEISRPSSSHKENRRTLPMTPSDIEVLCGDSPEEYFAKQSRRKKHPARSEPQGARVFPPLMRNNQDSGLGESLCYRDDGKGGRPLTTYPWKNKSPEKKGRPSSAYSCAGDANDEESESFPTITPISVDTGSPISTAAESDPVYKPLKTDKTTSSPIRKRNQIPLRRFLSHDRVRAHRRHAALLLVFRYLSPLELCGLAQVCREWRSLSEHPSLWKHVCLVDTAVNNMTLLSISRRCKPLQHLFLKGLKKTTPRKGVRRKDGENCYLEKGLEYILKVSAENMLSIQIEGCGNLLTDRCLLLTGSHCRNLQSFTYISDKYPACPEALWALWNCRNLATLRVPPMIPNEHPKRFNDKSCETIANCWPAITKLSIGGPGITTTGLLHIAKGCLRLQELELDRTHHVTEETAYALCLTGLRGLQVLLFTFTTASPGAIKQFYAACPRLEFIAVHVGISDYFSDVTDQENIHKYKRIISKLEALREENSDLARVLRIKADYG